MLRCFSKQESQRAGKPACPDVIENTGDGQAHLLVLFLSSALYTYNTTSFPRISLQNSSSMCMQSICANEGCGKSERWRTYGINAYREPYRLIMYALLITCIDTCRDLVGLRQGEPAHLDVTSVWVTALLSPTLTIPSSNV